MGGRTLSYNVRLLFLILLDSFIVLTAIFLASWIVDPFSQYLDFGVLMVTSIALLLFHHIFAGLYKLYNKVWAYASVGELFAIVQAVTFSVLAAGVMQFFANDFAIYKRLLIITWLLHIIFIGGSRFAWRIFRDKFIGKSTDSKRTLIVGAGDAGAMIIRQLRNANNDSGLNPVAFVDDDPHKQRMHLYNIPVLGAVKDIEKIVERKRIELIIIAIPSLGNGKLQQIVEECNKTKVEVQMIPKLEDLMTGKVSVNQLKNVEVEDLLGREPVQLDIESIAAEIKDETVMVTGAGGSIGSELCRQLLRFSPKCIVLLGHGEHSIYKIHTELSEEFGDHGVHLSPVIGDIKDSKRMEEIIEKYKPITIYHAAAHKHVPLMEENPHEAVKNNIMGTRNVAEAANKAGVNKFVLVSTDKAVNPTNVMGATKRIAEMIIQQMDKKSDTIYTAVRFGNVLGSRGSVIPRFKKQIRSGGPVTVTHQDMTRYFMTIPEASRLVIQASALAKGGEIFVLDMGEPVKIIDLAQNVITLSGYTIDEIGIRITGIRKGEKMYEELLGEDEIHPDAVYEKIYVGRTIQIDVNSIRNLIQNFHSLSGGELKDELMDIVYMERELMKA